MNRLKATAVIVALAVAGFLFAPPARSDEYNKSTVLTVNEPIEIPGQVLQPGKYTLKLADSDSNRHIVQVFNEDGTRLITTVLAIPNYRLQPTDQSQFGFWEATSGQPRALRSWFYPGDNFGQEFAYPRERAMQIASGSGQSVPAQTGPSEVQRVTPEGATAQAETQPATPPPAATTPPVEQPPAQAEAPAAPAPAPAPIEQARAQPAPPPPAPAAPAAPAQPMPETASPLPLISLGGLVSLGGAAVLRRIMKRMA